MNLAAGRGVCCRLNVCLPLVPFVVPCCSKTDHFLCLHTVIAQMIVHGPLISTVFAYPGSDAEKVQEVLSDPNPQVRVQGLYGSSHFRQDLTYQKSSHAAQIDGDERLGGPPYKPLTRDPGLRPG